MFAAISLSRLTQPLSLNFVCMTHLDNQITPNTPMQQETSFTAVRVRGMCGRMSHEQVAGHLSVLPFMQTFSTYYPMIMLGVRSAAAHRRARHLPSILTLFGLPKRLLSLIGLGDLFDDKSQNEDYSLEGRGIINREKRKRHRSGGDGPAAVRAWCVLSDGHITQIALNEVRTTGKPRFQRLPQGMPLLCLASDEREQQTTSTTRTMMTMTSGFW